MCSCGPDSNTGSVYPQHIRRSSLRVRVIGHSDCRCEARTGGDQTNRAGSTIGGDTLPIVSASTSARGSPWLRAQGADFASAQLSFPEPFGRAQALVCSMKQDRRIRRSIGVFRHPTAGHWWWRRRGVPVARLGFGMIGLRTTVFDAVRHAVECNLDTMWHNATEMYLEPGEVEAVVAALRDAAARQADTHPRALMLAAVAGRVAALVEGPGATVAVALVGAVREAAQAYLRPRFRRVVRLLYRPALRGA